MKSIPADRSDATTTIQQLKDARTQFITERGWEGTRQPRNLAISIAVEAAELLEHMQWQDYSVDKKTEVADELADIISYCVDFAAATGIDIASSFFDKLEHIEQKFPNTTFKPGKDFMQPYQLIKKTYRKQKKTDKYQ